jgi:hypothetical protein
MRRPPPLARDPVFGASLAMAVVLGVGVENEEQGKPVAVCEPVAAWSELWPRFRHLD